MTTKGRVDTALLRSLSLLGGASEEHIQKLVAAASLRTAPSRIILFAEGSRVDQLFVLIRGAVELFSEQDERRFTVLVVRPTHPLELSSILADRHPLSARVLEPSEFVCMPARLIIEFLSSDAGLAGAMVRELSRESLGVIED